MTPQQHGATTTRFLEAIRLQIACGCCSLPLKEVYRSLANQMAQLCSRLSSHAQYSNLKKKSYNYWGSFACETLTNNPHPGNSYLAVLINEN